MANGIVILYRVCDSVECYNGGRVFGNKLEIIKHSVNSIASSIKNVASRFEIHVNVIFDNTSDSTKAMIAKTLLPTTKNVSFYNTKPGRSGNMESLKLAYTRASEYKDALLFFVEDDYVLAECCLYEMWWIYNAFSSDQHVCLKPHHDILTFTRDIIHNDGSIDKRELILGHSVYWFRDVTSTCTFCIDDYVLSRCGDMFDKTFAMDRVKEDYINQIWKRFPLFAPISTLGEHLQNETTVSPYFNNRKFDMMRKYKVSMGE